MLIASRIGTETNSLYSGRKKREDADKDAELFMPRRDVAVPELSMKDEAFFRPVSVQGLVGFEAFIAKKGFILLGFNESGVHVEGGLIYGILFINGGDKVGVDAFKGQKEVGQRGDDGFALNAGIVFMKGGKVPEDGGGGRDRPMLLLAPSLLCFPSLLSREVFKLDAAEYAAEPLIGFKYAEVVDRLPSGEIEEDEGENGLCIRPALDFRVEMRRDGFFQIENGGKVEVDGKSRQGGHAARRLLFFVLVGEWAL
jgi:hypothetical protein